MFSPTNILFATSQGLEIYKQKKNREINLTRSIQHLLSTHIESMEFIENHKIALFTFDRVIIYNIKYGQLSRILKKKNDAPIIKFGTAIQGISPTKFLIMIDLKGINIINMRTAVIINLIHNLFMTYDFFTNHLIVQKCDGRILELVVTESKDCESIIHLYYINFL